MMKTLFTKRAFAALAVLMLSLSAFAQPADVAGKYSGSATIEGPGTVNIRVEIIVKDDKYSGTVDSDMGGAAITGGSYADNKLTLNLDAQGSVVTMNGTVAEDGKITGDLSGAITGTFQMTKDAATR